MAESDRDPAQVRKDFDAFMKTAPSSDDAPEMVTVVGNVMQSKDNKTFMLQMPDRAMLEVPRESVAGFEVIASGGGGRMARLTLNPGALPTDIVDRLKPPFDTLKEPPLDKPPPFDKNPPFDTFKEPPSDKLPPLDKNPPFDTIKEPPSDKFPPLDKNPPFDTFKEPPSDKLPPLDKNPPFDTFKEMPGDKLPPTDKNPPFDTLKEPVGDTQKEMVGDPTLVEVPGGGLADPGGLMGPRPEAALELMRSAQPMAAQAAINPNINAFATFKELVPPETIKETINDTLKEVINDPTFKEIPSDPTLKEVPGDPTLKEVPFEGTGVMDTLVEGRPDLGGMFGNPVVNPAMAGMAAGGVPFVLATPHQAGQGAVAQQMLAAQAMQGRLGF